MDTDFNNADVFTVSHMMSCDLDHYYIIFFQALGNIYLIHKRAPSFYLWNFNSVCVCVHVVCVCVCVSVCFNVGSVMTNVVIIGVILKL